MKWANPFDRVRAFRFLDTSMLSKRKRALVTLLRWINHISKELSKDRCPEKAASLAFTTVLTLIPVCALFVSYFKWIGKLDVVSEALQAWIVKILVVGAAQNVTVYIDDLVQQLNPSKLGIYGLAGFVFSAYMLIRAIERAVNDIWKISSHRSFLQRSRLLLMGLIAAPLFMFFSMYFWGMVQNIKLLGNYEHVSFLKSMLHLVGPYFLSFPAFLILLKLLPNTKVKWKYAFTGTLVTSILFEGAKHVFGWYVTEILPVSKLYGSLGLFPIFLIWLFVSWLVFLIGVDITYTSQNLKRLHLRELERWSD